MECFIKIWKVVSQHCTVFAICIVFSIIYDAHGVCELTPAGIIKPRNRMDAGRYIIEIPGKPQTYTPGQKYNISLKVNPELIHQKAFRNFILTVLPANTDNDDHPVGQLELEYSTEMLTRFSRICPNTVVDSTTVPKTEIQVYWIAPPENSGCVAIKATVVESKENWFSEDGPLTKILCEETAEDENVAPEILRHCCACQEAKYEVAFEGKWTRNTHPRHFPPDVWNTRFSDVVGASHKLHHSFWEYDNYASDGLKELAETGVTKTLETELKNDSENIRTIIKARGLHYPNITKSTYAVFRVDNRNHLVSLVSKITPSPDWIVGVSNLELCRPDCTWEESRTLNLYPWDVGTNDGIDYTSSVPTSEKHPIRKITPNNPNNPSSPFYNEQGEDIKPIAKLHLTRQRLYNKTCENITSNKIINCDTTDWSKWSVCSARCGKGLMFRQRNFIDESEADNCDVDLLDIKECFEYSKRCKYMEELKPDTTEAETETEITTEIDTESTTETSTAAEEDPNCPGTYWGEWSNCSVNCGKGVRSRMRELKPDFLASDELEQECFGSETEECTGLCDEEKKTTAFERLDAESIVISQEPDGRVVNCKVSGWSKWSKCLLNDKEAICGKGYRYKDRQILRHPENGGTACPSDLRREKSCTIHCPSFNACIMGPWSEWTPCSSNCGRFAVQVRTRNILYQPSGVECYEKREEKRLCKLPLACNDRGLPIN